MVTVGTESRIIPQRIDLKHMFPDIPWGRYLTHGFDSYPAKMIPHMARFLIEKISKPGQTILDPFCGSGAVLIQSVISGRNAIGVDLNPLAILFAKAKTTSYDLKLLHTQLDKFLEEFGRCSHPHEYDFPNANYWFTPATLRKLGVIKTVLDTYLPRVEPDYAFFWRAVAAAIVRECSNADTRGPKPFISKRARDKRLGKDFDPFELLASKTRSWISMQERYAAELKKNGKGVGIGLIEGDARNLSQLVASHGGRVDVVITSPPYLSAQDYYRASKLQLFILGHLSPAELTTWSRELVGSDRIHSEEALLSTKLTSRLAERIKQDLAKRNKRNAYVFAKYVLDMSKVLSEIEHVLGTGSYCAIVSGYNLISGISIPTPDVITELANRSGFQLEACHIDLIRDRWVPTIRNGHTGVIDEEHLLVFKKTR